MTYEEMEKTMQFILEQQAQFNANFQRLEEAREEDLARTKHLEESFLILVRLVQSHNERIVSEEDRSISFEERIAYLDERMISLTEAQIRTNQQLAETDERLNALIAVVERYISSQGQNGSSQG